MELFSDTPLDLSVSFFTFVGYLCVLLPVPVIILCGFSSFVVHECTVMSLIFVREGNTDKPSVNPVKSTRVGVGSVRWGFLYKVPFFSSFSCSPQSIVLPSLIQYHTIGFLHSTLEFLLLCLNKIVPSSRYKLIHYFRLMTYHLCDNENKIFRRRYPLRTFLYVVSICSRRETHCVVTCRCLDVSSETGLGGGEKW